MRGAYHQMFNGNCRSRYPPRNKERCLDVLTITIAASSLGKAKVGISTRRLGPYEWGMKQIGDGTIFMTLKERPACWHWQHHFADLKTCCNIWPQVSSECLLGPLFC